MSPRRVTETGGVAAYLGYEYQIVVSTWIALELVFRRRLSDCVHIEPASDEDVAATLRVPPELAESTLGVTVSSLPIEIQIKRRSEPWQPSDFGPILATDAVAGSRGPSPRHRILARLGNDPSLHYLLVTDAEAAAKVKAFVVPDIGSRSSHDGEKVTVSTGVEMPRDTAERIGILEKRVLSLVEKDIDEILELSARVPLQKVGACRNALTETVRACLLRQRPEVLGRAELEEIFRRFAGLPPAAGDEFVPPANFEELTRHLDEPPFALIIGGPPGFGKTMAAERLVAQHKMDTRPFEVIENPSVGTIRSHLRTPGRTLFYLEDPWGRYKQSAEAATWRDELPRLIAHAKNNPDKRFLATTRTSVLAPASRATALDPTLSASFVPITEAHFDEPARREVLRRWMYGAPRALRDWVERRMPEIVLALTAPQALAEFATQVAQCHDDSSRDLKKLLQTSQTTAVGHVVSQHVHELGLVPEAVVLWAFLGAGESFRKQDALSLTLSLNRVLKSTVDIPRLVTELKGSRWLKEKGGGLSAHPSVIEALEGVVDGEPVATHEVLVGLFTALVSRNDLDVAARLVLRLDGRDLPIPPAARVAIERHLVDAVIAAPDDRLHVALGALGQMSSANDPVSRLARAIVGPRSHACGIPTWVSPTWTESQSTLVAQSKEAESVARRYVRHALGDRSTEFGSERLADFLNGFGWDLSDDFHQAAVQAIRYGDHQDVALRGALAGPSPNYDALLAVALERYDEVTNDFEHAASTAKQTQANECELDAAYSAHVLDLPSEQFYGPRSALEAIVAARRARDGYDWIANHPRCVDLIAAWGKSLLPQAGEVLRDELQLMHGRSEDWNRGEVWAAVGRSGCKTLASEALRALASGPLDALPAVWGCIFSLFEPAALSVLLSPLLASLAWPRRASVVVACFSAHLDVGDMYYRDPTNHIEVVLQLLTTDERAAIDACRQMAKKDSHTRLTSVVLGKVAELAGGPDHELAAIACILEAAQGRPVGSAIGPLLLSPQDLVRLRALRALTREQPIDRGRVVRLLCDEYYQCRRLAMYALADEASGPERDAILAMARDKSAPVREACARIVGDHRWVEAAEVLCDLLLDSRDRNESAFVDATPDHHVARAAARSLGVFEVPVSKAAARRIVDFLNEGIGRQTDIVVHTELVSALVRLSDSEVPPLIERFLHSDARMGGENGSFPLRYAAAWAWTEELLRSQSRHAMVSPLILADAALSSDDYLAAPSLIALGIIARVAPDGAGRVLYDPELTAERALLIELGARLGEDPGADEFITRRVEKAHPGRQVLAWCWRSGSTEDWSAQMASSPEVEAWLKRVRTPGAIHAALRKGILMSPRGTEVPDISADDLHEGELTNGTPAISTFSFAGLE